AYRSAVYPDAYPSQGMDGAGASLQRPIGRRVAIPQDALPTEQRPSGDERRIREFRVLKGDEQGLVVQDVSLRHFRKEELSLDGNRDDSAASNYMLRGEELVRPYGDAASSARE